jgi:hypothetical protein
MEPRQYVATWCETPVVDDFRCGDEFPEDDAAAVDRLVPAMGGVFLGAIACKDCWGRLLRWMDGAPTEDA